MSPPRYFSSSFLSSLSLGTMFCSSSCTRMFSEHLECHFERSVKLCPLPHRRNNLDHILFHLLRLFQQLLHLILHDVGQWYVGLVKGCRQEVCLCYAIPPVPPSLMSLPPSCPSLHPFCPTLHSSCPTLHSSCPSLHLSCPTLHSSCPTLLPESCPSGLVSWSISLSLP